VKLLCYNLKGDVTKIIIDREERKAGEHIIEWDMKDENNNLLPSGIYWLMLSYENKKFTEKIIVIQ